MSNPVAEDLQSWQPDAAAGDTNAPSAASAGGIGDAQDLSGNLRLLKSVIRALAAHMSWERWLGIKNLANNASIAFTFASTTTFTVNDNFSSTGRNVAQVGRRVRVTQTGAVIYGTITVVVWSSPSTTITVVLDSSVLNAGLTEIQFGPEPLSGSSVFPAGTVALPGLSVAGDPDTGLYEPAANQLAIALAGVARVLFAAAGITITGGGLTSNNVGAGANPSLIARAHPTLDIGEIGTITNHALNFITNATTRGFIDNAGLVRFSDQTSNAGGARRVQATIPADGDYANGDITYVTA